MSTRGQVRRYARNGRHMREVIDLTVPPFENLEQAGGPVRSVDPGGQEEVSSRLGLNRANKHRRRHSNQIVNSEHTVNLEGSSSSMRGRARYMFEYLKSKFLNLATRTMQLHSLQIERSQNIAPPLPPPTPQEPTITGIAAGRSRNQVKKRRRRRSNPPPEEPRFSCPVCMGPLVEEVTTKCGHIFCKECIMAAIKAQHKCPTCRQKLTIRNLTRIYLPTTM